MRDFDSNHFLRQCKQASTCFSDFLPSNLESGYLQGSPRLNAENKKQHLLRLEKRSALSR